MLYVLKEFTGRKYKKHVNTQNEIFYFFVFRPRDTNKFQISINIAAFSEVTFTLNYNELLQRRRGNYDHTIYVNPGQIVDSLLVEVTIQESRAITQLHVPPLRNDILTEHQNSSE